MAYLKLKLMVVALLMLSKIVSTQYSIVINQGGSTSVNNGEIWVNGIRVTDNCTQPLSQDLQAAIDQLRSNNNTSNNNNSTPATPTKASNRFFWAPFQNFFENFADSMSKMFAATTLAIDSRVQASSAFVKVIQDKVGPNVLIQSIIAKDGCIWVNGIPIDKLLTNQTNAVDTTTQTPLNTPSTSGPN